MKKVYFDSVATTSLNPEVSKTYKKLLDEYYCNSDALYDDGVAIYRMMETSRKNIANMLKVDEREVIFTSGASEANSMAIKGLCLNQTKRKHIITSVYEHSSAHNAIKQLEENFGFEVDYLMPDANGVIDPQKVKEKLRSDTILVSIMFVNNEIGAINDIDEIGRIVKLNSGTYFHSDLTQGIGKLDFSLKNIDLACFSAHKLHGLKGSGILIKKQHVNLLPLINGGQQEFGIRGGTSNALVNICFAKTLRIALENKDKYKDYIHSLNEYFINEAEKISGLKINNVGIDSLINLSTPVKSEVMLNALNLRGIMVSSKSTCSSREHGTNRALSAIGVDEDYAIRVSFDYSNTREEIDYFMECIKEAIKKYGA